MSTVLDGTREMNQWINKWNQRKKHNFGWGLWMSIEINQQCKLYYWICWWTGIQTFVKHGIRLIYVYMYEYNIHFLFIIGNMHSLLSYICQKGKVYYNSFIVISIVVPFVVIVFCFVFVSFHIPFNIWVTHSVTILVTCANFVPSAINCFGMTLKWWWAIFQELS